MLRAVARIGFGLALPLVLAGCAPTVRSQAHPALQEVSGSFGRVAVAPFSVRVLRAPGSEDREGGIPDEAAALVARYLAEALGQTGFEVVAPEEVHTALTHLSAEELAAAPADERAGSPAAVGPLVAQRFGADVLVMGQLNRFRERVGQAMGATRPASVAFEVTLYDAASGKRLWTGLFDETQQPVSENLFNLGRYPAGGSRWLTAEELARWGARELAAALPRSGG